MDSPFGIYAVLVQSKKVGENW